MMKIAVDAMGGDHAPKVVVNGIERARDQHPTWNLCCLVISRGPSPVQSGTDHDCSHDRN